MGNMETVGDLVVMFNGMSINGVWHGQWSIHRSHPPGKPNAIALGMVDEGVVDGPFEDMLAGRSAAREVAIARAKELTDGGKDRGG